MTSPRYSHPQEALVPEAPVTHRARAFRARRGFALPLALFFIAIMTVTLTASFMMTSGERRSNDSQAAQQRAYNNAAVGLEAYMGDRGTQFKLTGPPVVNEAEQKFQISTSNLDSAYILARRLRTESGTPGQVNYVPALYAIRSKGIYRGGKLPGVGNAERAVGMLAVYEKGNLSVLAGWTSLSGMRKNGSSGLMSGEDHCGKATQLAGVAMPDGGFSGNSDAIVGNPAIKYLGTQEQTNAAVKINWDAIKNGSAITADFVDTWPAASSWDDPNFWPIVHWTGDRVITLPKLHNSQRGMLIIDGDLALGGEVTWDGIILVGGNITSNGNNTVYGAIVTGLDEKIGEDVISNEIGNGTKIYQYDSCNVEKATASMGSLRALRNTFIDNWRTF
jgi:hypothetical protein